MKERLLEVYRDFKNSFVNIHNEIREKLEFVNEKLGWLDSKKFKVKMYCVSLANIIIVLLLVTAFVFPLVPKITYYIIKSQPETITSQPSYASSPRIEQPPSQSNSPAPVYSVHDSIPPEPEQVDFSNIAPTLSGTAIVQDFPSKVTAGLRFFTFVGGNRIWQNEYIITKGSVVEGQSKDAEVKVILHSKYVERFYREDFCNVLKDANKNGDLGYETHLGTIALAWKFKSLLKYKSCLS